MKKTRQFGSFLATVVAIIILNIATSAQAVTVDWITIGDAGNPDDVHDEGFGGVDYEYRISRTVVTNIQYVEFLNEKATIGDPFGLYRTQMTTQTWGGINRAGAGTVGDPYVYSVKPDVPNKGPGGTPYKYANMPLSNVSWYDAVRFANWMHNGQGSGDTETGAYTLLGGTTVPSNGTTVTREPDAQIFLSSTDEWYKAAYYDPNKAGGAGYWLYPYGSDSPPDNNMPSADSGNSANWGGAGAAGSWSYPLLEVGSYPLSKSPYGVSDQGGDVYEWHETAMGTYRRNWGGGWAESSSIHMEATDDTHYNDPSFEHYRVGIRLASVVPACTCIIGDADCDGDVDIDDIIGAFPMFTGPGSFGRTRAQGDVHGDLEGATTNCDGHDGDVDVSDILTMFGQFTGPMDSLGLVAAAAGDPTIPDLIYDPATGEVVLSVDSGSIIGYSLKSAGGFLAGGHTPILGGVSTSLSTELAEAALSSSSGSIGFVFPLGLDLAGLSALLTDNTVSTGLGAPLVPFDLVVLGPAVPEPATVAMALMGLIGLGFVAYRRRAA